MECIFTDTGELMNSTVQHWMVFSSVVGSVWVVCKTADAFAWAFYQLIYRPITYLIRRLDLDKTFD